ncbi:MAG: transporter [Betaproteobacteria bacterium]|uniref:ZIP family metal transporter n=1 Tax=Novosphingobium aquiterrae TaxID=624388 RepID=A0ABV6PI48_9SPHN|nr:transporter [Betaproteobacteria bacterium]
MQALSYTLLPLGAVLIGTFWALWRRPGTTFVSATQHLAAGVVFAAAAVEILPQIKHEASPTATLIGGAIGVGVMLAIKALEERSSGPIAMLAATGIDIFIDGLVLGLAFIAGERAGILLAVALTLEVLFLGLSITSEMQEGKTRPSRTIAIAIGLGILLPLGALIATPVALLPPVVVTGFLSFGLMALLYLVTEELLVEAHEKPDTPLISSMFFVGFLGLLVLEELMG